MTAQDDQNFYEKKERLLRWVQAGTATQAQKEWLARWGFLEKSKPPPLKPTYDSPTDRQSVPLSWPNESNASGEGRGIAATKDPDES